MALFPRCNNPVPVVGRHGVTLVGCHSCIQCRVAAQEHLCKILEVEASKHKYVEFLTITYDDMHLPTQILLICILLDMLFEFLIGLLRSIIGKLKVSTLLRIKYLNCFNLQILGLQILLLFCVIILHESINIIVDFPLVHEVFVITLLFLSSGMMILENIQVV